MLCDMLKFHTRDDMHVQCPVVRTDSIEHPMENLKTIYSPITSPELFTPIFCEANKENGAVTGLTDLRPSSL